ncbi:hypothetical protein EMIHUDRAFT_227891 [Emiliania huxleyi CCMP1516]|uniref:PH domain-containing protein n=2 Tax=Emiliania huxleyi TaxID=2903 RepID=A0A0D3KH75_EMIH1|nr:hypothetical protein EMIHUDRAFT_227891 [Emiliania huxleyi CCMP1516]EOD35110.1 hypothetical protein EMIHUDRAFT_227891 [Emiliania huxleyi CCMP1516]|eukprot:XP_005787539.1 hypothetical protein EMIHUDRAFT_227891 [Emiliania huxleyi CCMP1516]
MLPETFEPLPPEFEALVGRRPDLQRLRFWTVCDLGSADVEATLLAAAFVVRGGHLSKWRKGGRAGTHDRFIKVASKDGGAAGAVLLWESKRGDIVRADDEIFTSCFEGTAETSQCFQVVLERRMLFFSAHASSRQRWCEGINCLASGRVRVLAATTRAGRATADSATPDYVVVQDCATGGVYAWNTRNEEANWIRSSGVPSSAGASSCRLSSDEPAAHSVSDPADAGHEAGGRPSPLPRLTEATEALQSACASQQAAVLAASLEQFGPVLASSEQGRRDLKAARSYLVQLRLAAAAGTRRPHELAAALARDEASSLAPAGSTAVRAALRAALAVGVDEDAVAAAKATLRELEEASARFDAEAAEARLALEGSSRSGDPTQIEARHSVQVERSAATFGLSSATADAAVATAEPDSESSPSAVKALRALETALARAAAAGVSGLAMHRAQSQRALMSGAAEALRREEDALSWIRESIQAGRA